MIKAILAYLFLWVIYGFMFQEFYLPEKVENWGIVRLLDYLGFALISMPFAAVGVYMLASAWRMATRERDK